MKPSIDNGGKALERAVAAAARGVSPERLVPNGDLLDLIAYAKAMEEIAVGFMIAAGAHND